jgi:RNA recognition motif-containing protein
MFNIYIGNLEYSAREKDITEIFEKFGEVSSAKVIMEHDSDRNRGYGFIIMPDEDDALAAIEGLDGTQFMGRELKVNKARERERQPRPVERTYRSGGNRSYDNDRRRDENYNR